jgi:hypothetical protein
MWHWRSQIPACLQPEDGHSKELSSALGVLNEQAMLLQEMLTFQLSHRLQECNICRAAWAHGNSS